MDKNRRYSQALHGKRPDLTRIPTKTLGVYGKSFKHFNSYRWFVYAGAVFILEQIQPRFIHVVIVAPSIYSRANNLGIALISLGLSDTLICPRHRFFYQPPSFH